MKVGKHWTYQVRSNFETRVEPIKVLRPMAVASASGYELVGPLGVSRLAWKNGTLYADSTVDVQFLPPIPLLVPGADLARDKERDSDKVKDKVVATWVGTLVVKDKKRSGNAELAERTETIDLGTRKVPTIRTTLTIHLRGGTIALQSWYQQGTGLVRQEQRTNGTRIVHLEMLGHGD